MMENASLQLNSVRWCARKYTEHIEINIWSHSDYATFIKQSILYATQDRNYQEMAKHSAICYAQNKHLSSLPWFRSATWHANNIGKSFFHKHVMKASEQYYWDIILLSQKC